MNSANSNARRPMDGETIIALVLLGIGVLAVGDFSLMLWSGLLSLAH